MWGSGRDPFWFIKGVHGYSNASPKGRDEDSLSFLKGWADDTYSLGSIEGPTVGSGGDPYSFPKSVDGYALLRVGMKIFIYFLEVVMRIP